MTGAFLGVEALAAGVLTRAQLRARHRAVFPGVYAPRDAPRTLALRAHAAWLWSGRRGVITGVAAAALHGARWVDDDTVVDLLWRNEHPPRGITARADRYDAEDVVILRGMAVASVRRAAFDIGRHECPSAAVARLDALARVSLLRPEHLRPLLDRHRGDRGVRRLREALERMDAGAQSPRETALRLLLVEGGLPRPRTQIPVGDGPHGPWAYLDMGWEHLLLAVEYDGDHHRSDRRQYVRDIARLRALEALGWRVERVVAEDRPAAVLARVRRAWAAREAERRVVAAAPPRP